MRPRLSPVYNSTILHTLERKHLTITQSAYRRSNNLLASSIRFLVPRPYHQRKSYTSSATTHATPKAPLHSTLYTTARRKSLRRFSFANANSRPTSGIDTRKRSGSKNQIRTMTTPSNPEDVMVIRELVPGITTLSLPFARGGLIKFGGRATIGVYSIHNTSPSSKC